MQPPLRAFRLCLLGLVSVWIPFAALAAIDLELKDGTTVTVDKVTRQDDGLLTITGRAMRKYETEELSVKTRKAYDLWLADARAVDAEREAQRAQAKERLAALREQQKQVQEARRRETAAKERMLRDFEGRLRAARERAELERHTPERRREIEDLFQRDEERMRAFITGLLIAMPEESLRELVKQTFPQAHLEVDPRSRDRRVLIMRHPTKAGEAVFFFQMTDDNRLAMWEMHILD